MTTFEKLYKSLLAYRFTDKEGQLLIERIWRRTDWGYHSEGEIIRRHFGYPSAADLDAVADEERIKWLTNGKPTNQV